MSEFPQKINTSYESGTSSSSGSTSTEPGLDKSMQLDDIEGNKLACLLLPGGGAELYNTSAEEGIFPNVSDCPPIVPSYQPDYDYNIEYSSSCPLVYSWLPIVPGFSSDGYDNLHNFQHLAQNQEKFHDDDSPIFVGSSSPESTSIPNQNKKYHEFLVINSTEAKLSKDNPRVEFNDHENSCNAMDLNISMAPEKQTNPDFSFDGKIQELMSRQETASEEQPIDESFGQEKEDEQITEEERIQNESFEVLQKEDSRKIASRAENEQSPEIFNQEEPQSDIEDTEVATCSVTPEEAKQAEDCDAILKKMKNSLTGICPPPSVTQHQISLSEMIFSYNKNKEQCVFKSKVENQSFFVPSHTPEEIVNMEWPNMLSTKCLGVTYNKSDACEDIEGLFSRYIQRNIGAETSSSFNFKVGPSSARKKIDKLKQMGQSPGRRLSHLANRRKIFSSANLKSSSLSTSHSSKTSNFGLRVIDKSKLYSKSSKLKSPKKRPSEKKKTSGKKKTPRSAKRPVVTISESLTRASSKRALFTSPLGTKTSSSLSITQSSRLPRRSLFPSDNIESKKRRSSTSPDPEAENRLCKQRRIDLMPKSQSFSIASTSTNTNVNESFRNQLFCRTQSEAVLNSNHNTPNATNLGFKGVLTVDVKKKILWSVSTALASKQITNEHEKFKQYASLLAKLVKKIFLEFYNPAGKSLSGQLMKFASHMVYFVVHGKVFDEIYLMTKSLLQTKAAFPAKVNGYIAQKDYEQSSFVRKSSSFFSLASQSCSTLNLSQQSENSFGESSLRLNESTSSLNRSSSKNNEMSALRENFLGLSGDKSARKFGGSDSNLSNTKSASNSSLMKAKRQISF